MKALYEKIPLAPGESLACREYRSPTFTMPWHFHPECELTLIQRGRGTRFVGDSIERFADGDLVFLGSNLPHYWWKDGDDRRHAAAVVLQFDETFSGRLLLELPEASRIRALLRASRRGVLFPEAASGEIAGILARLPALRGWPRLCGVFDLLGLMAELRPVRLLASAGYAPDLDERDGNRLTEVCRYVNASFAGEVSQPRAAGLAGLSPAAFSRYFHKRMGRTFEGYVNEVRIGHASRRLMDTDRTVAEIAFASGFNNLSNFNRHFLRLKGMTPKEYRRQTAPRAA